MTFILYFVGTDPQDDDAPVFIREPLNEYFIVKGKPVTVTCQAAPAAQIGFKCASQWVNPDYQTNEEVVEPETGARTLVSSIEVSKEDVEGLSFGGIEREYWCECFAWSARPDTVQGTQSRRGVVKIASKLIDKALPHFPNLYLTANYPLK